MPPRIPAPQGLRSLSLCLRPTPSLAPSLQPLIQTANLSMREKKRKMKQDPYGWAQSEQRKAAHVARKNEIKAERDAKWGDPVHGITTPFVESFDSAGQEPFSRPPLDLDGNPLEEPHPLPTAPHIINHLLTDAELQKAIEESKVLTSPLLGDERTTPDSQQEAEELEQHARNHRKAVIALQRITDLKNGSGKDRKHANMRRCIETFGRHVTDKTLPNAAPPLAAGVVPQKTPVRAGPDTGSSEVQIAILTSKIRAVSKMLESKGKKDMHNKRRLRNLVHKRQRLLRYMERKERGSGRWQFMCETLGITPATYKGQISI
ncbi:hypothetical protein QBC35DRAFT_508719 [Podospora australis]|uniref:Mitochondrial SSU ribosomal protein S15 n=1 Tax=Podospora australis TaxID=1536484 RepID=A0AAN6WMX7_9PEZI|nr:hypothetical protein QBC35DRAFT_508719 [Podospora australis]